MARPGQARPEQEGQALLSEVVLPVSARGPRDRSGSCSKALVEGASTSEASSSPAG